MVDLRIEELVLRVPGISRETGRLVAHEVTRQLQRELRDFTGDATRVLSRLDLRVRVAPGASATRIAQTIVAEMKEALEAALPRPSRQPGQPWRTWQT